MSILHNYASNNQAFWRVQDMLQSELYGESAFNSPRNTKTVFNDKLLKQLTKIKIIHYLHYHRCFASNI